MSVHVVTGDLRALTLLQALVRYARAHVAKHDGHRIALAAAVVSAWISLHSMPLAPGRARTSHCRTGFICAHRRACMHSCMQH